MCAYVNFSLMLNYYYIFISADMAGIKEER
jgi:hypothetical protein